MTVRPKGVSMGHSFGDTVMYGGEQCTYIGYSVGLNYHLLNRPWGGWGLSKERIRDLVNQKNTDLLNRAIAGGFTNNLYWVFKV